MSGAQWHPLINVATGMMKYALWFLDNNLKNWEPVFITYAGRNITYLLT